jgi:hypothetical protein
VACGIATFALKLWANAERVVPGHGDTAYYFHVAQNLYAGRGFVCDYVWSFLENPSGAVPAPSHGWWMPGPSVVAWLGMLAAREDSYAAAKVAMAALTSLLPAVVWWTARVIAHDRSLAARAAVLSVSFHPFLDQPAAPLSHGPYGMIAGAALALLSRGSLTARGGLLLGALVGLAHLFRGDALLLLGTAAALGALSLRRRGLAATAVPLVTAILAYLVVMAPWFARNIAAFGAPVPPGPSRALYLRDYFDWFALPDRLDAEHYLAGGLAPLLREKLEQSGSALWSLVASYFDPTIPTNPGAWFHLRHVSIAMSVLTFAGLARLAFARSSKRWLAVYGLHALGGVIFYAWLFTGVANQSYVSSLYSLYPLFIVGMAGCLDLRRPLLSWSAILVLAAANALGGADYLRSHKGPAASLVHRYYREVGERLIKAGFDPVADRVMLRDPMDLYAATRLSGVRIPHEPIPRILSTAKRLGVRFFLLEDSVKADRSTRPYRPQDFFLEEGENFETLFRYETRAFAESAKAPGFALTGLRRK